MTATRPPVTRPTRNLRTLALRQSPLQHPPFRVWHLVLLLALLLVAALTYFAPGLMSDLASVRFANWKVFVTLQTVILLFAIYALVGVRSYHPTTGIGLGLTCLAMALGIGLTTATEYPMPAYSLLLLGGLAAPLFRVIPRLNDTDRLRRCAEREQTYLAEIARLTAELEEVQRDYS